MPSNYEGLGLAAIEAQASGLACIVSSNVLAANVIGNLKRISLDESDQVWADNILNIQQLDRNAIKYKFVDAGYDIKKEAERLQGFYEDIAD